MWFHSKGRIFLHVYHCVFFPSVVRILVGRLDLCFLTHTKKDMAPIHALIFQKHVKNVCLYQTYQKAGVTLLHFWGSTCSKKRVGWEVIFSELGFAGSGARKPRREFKGSALEPFFHVFLRLSRALIVQLNYHIKASVKLMTFARENQIIPWQGVYFFTNTVLQNHSNIYTVMMKHDKHHW